MAETNGCVAEEFLNELGRLRRQRLTALGEAASIHGAMQSLLQHEVQRLESRPGPQHPRTAQLEARLRGSAQLTHLLEVERQLFAIEVPEVTGEAALVHGRLVDEDDLGIHRLTVCLVDRSGQPAEAAEAASDASGYFAIVLGPEDVDRLATQHAGSVFLAVFSPRRRLLLQQPKPLTLARGARLLVEIRFRRTDLTAAPSPPQDTVVLPDLVGMDERDALAALKGTGLTLGDRKTRPAPDQVDRVLEQSPAAGSTVPAGSSVSLVIGSEAGAVAVPSVIGMELKRAKEAILAGGLAVGTITGPSPSDQSTVRAQDPQPEAQVPPETRVNLVVSPPGGNVRSVVLEGMAADDAFGEVGASLQKLEDRLEAMGVQTRAHLSALLDRPDKDLRDDLRLPNLNAARAFKRLLEKELERPLD